MAFLRLAGFVVAFILIFTFLLYVIGIYDIK